MVWGLKQRAAWRGQRRAPPLALMHVPKSAGTALMDAISLAFPDEVPIGGFDRCLLGDFTGFDGFSALLRGRVFLASVDLPAEARLVMGHFAYSTLKSRYGQAPLVSFLREPFARLLSHWVFWRGQTDESLVHWGNDWTARVATARGRLSEFLAAPQVACQTDNVALRMLLWPHELIPAGGFIDPCHDRVLTGLALRRLNRLDYTDIVDEGEVFFQRFSAWLGVELQGQRANETQGLPAALQTRLAGELDPATLALMQARCRLDLVLWTALARRRMDEVAIAALRTASIARAAAHFTELLHGEPDLPAKRL